MRLRTIGLGTALVLSMAAPAASKNEEPSFTFKPMKADVGAGMVLADFDGKTVALVADEDDQTVRIFETKPPREVAQAKVPGTPSQIVVTKAGKVLVALRDKGQIAILEPKGGDVRTLVMKSSIDTGGEPVALGLTSDEATLVVASGWTHEVSAYAMSDRSLKFKTSVGREPRGLAIAPDGSKAWVNHAVGGLLTTIDLSDGKATSTTLNLPVANRSGRIATQGFVVAMSDKKVFAPTVLADPEAPETYYGSSLETFSVVTADALSGAVDASSKQIQPAAYNQLERCILPRAAAVTTDGKKLVVGCAGDNEIVVMDATAAAPRTQVLRKRDAGDSPSALAIDDATDTVVTWSQMGRQLSVVGIAEKATKLETTIASGGTLSAAAGRGRRLFNAVDGKTAADGRACASCHTDGRDDGLTWHTPDGNRQTPMLAGRLSDTAPYGWTRDAKTFHEYVTGTVARLRGKGYSKPELDDLSAYVMTLKPPARAAGDEATVNHGKEVFASSGCTSCHSGANSTDGQKHTITANGAANPGGMFATPSLRFVGGTAPYFHDGRYPSLRALLVSQDPVMGKARDLPAGDIDALESFLKTL